MSVLINLLPWRAQRLKHRARFWAGAAIVGLAVISMACGGWRWHLGRLIAQTALLQPSLAQLVALRAMNTHKQKQLDARVANHQQRLAARHRQQALQVWRHRLQLIAERLPDTIWLTALHFGEGKLEIDGKALSADGLSRWADFLKTLPGARELQQGATTRDADAHWNFHWTLSLEYDDVAAS